jgi:oxygen-independent coproporphyrinogen III oxidase
MPAESAALYVHFPYCVSICPYCDFDRQATGFASIPAYVEAVAAEIRMQSPRPVHSIFFGGGTPSLMAPGQVASLLEAASATFDLLPNCEITLEANPGECEADHLSAIRAAGANRLSIGVQSLNDGMLERLGRRHTADQARAAFRAARRAGFDNVNLDFMLGLPDLDLSEWRRTLDGAIDLDPEHLSCYILTVDERVPMGRDVASGRLTLPDDDAVAEQYLLTQERLAGAGYQQYEISNWARPGRVCRHNLTYWRDGPYVGVGAGAVGWHDGIRAKNTPSPRRYMASIKTGRVEHVEEERPDLETQMRDQLSLALRLREGLDPARFRARFGADVSDVLGQTLKALQAAGCLEWTDGSLRIAEPSVLVTSELLLRLDEAIERWVAERPSEDAGLQPATEREELVAGRST